MSTTFKINESYKHKCAKEIFKQWCQERPKDKYGDGKEWLTNFNCAISWRPNRSREAWLEYPIVVNDNINSVEQVWDEIWPSDSNFGPTYTWGDLDSDSTYRECKEKNFIPTYTECIEKNFIPIAVIDVVLPHKGTLYFCVEICHTNPVSDEKIKKLQQAGVRNLIEIDAEWILRQTKFPSKLQIKRWLIDDSRIVKP